MPGMNSGPSPASPILVSAFRSALLQQSLIVALIFALLLIAWGATRAAITAPWRKPPRRPPAWREPRARRLLRVGFGALWLFDGLLQAQPQMAGGLADQVIQPAASSSPGWVQHLVNFGVNVWDYHPVAGRRGVGLDPGRHRALDDLRGARLVRPARRARRGGLGAGRLGVRRGVRRDLRPRPDRAVRRARRGAPLRRGRGAPRASRAGLGRPRRLGRLLLGGAGAFFLGMALLQAWPGRGFWQGTLDGQPGSLTAMIKSMAGTSQPHALEVIVSGFGNFTDAHGFAVNLVAVLALAVRRRGPVQRGRPRRRTARPDRGHRRGRVLPRRLGARRGPRASSAASAPTRTP